MGDRQVGGLMALDADMRKAGVPPHWLGYVSTPDVDATVKQAQRAGGRLLAGPEEIPKVGRWAVLADPQGASFAAFTPAGSGSAADRRAIGHFSWAELNTTDWKSAWSFYSQLFGWKKTSSMDMGPEMGEYFMFGLDSNQSMGGMSNVARTMNAPPHWLQYINVSSVDETARRIAQMGGKVLNGPMDIPGDDRIAQCVDPQGAAFAIYSSKRK